MSSPPQLNWFKLPSLSLDYHSSLQGVCFFPFFPPSLPCHSSSLQPGHSWHWSAENSPLINCLIPNKRCLSYTGLLSLALIICTLLPLSPHPLLSPQCSLHAATLNALLVLKHTKDMSTSGSLPGFTLNRIDH